MELFGVSSVGTEVTKTARGPRAASASIACRRAASVVALVPERCSSSNWLGVSTSAAGNARSPENPGDAGADIDAAAGVPDHRIAAIARRRIGGLDLGYGIEHRIAGLRFAE